MSWNVWPSLDAHLDGEFAIVVAVRPLTRTCRLRVSYRPGPSTSHVAQLALYNAYKTRFDPYDAVSPLLGGQDLIELVCATFPGCEMSKAGDEYHLSGLREKEGGEGDWERTLEGVAEPVRAASWYVVRYVPGVDPSDVKRLLGTYQQTGDDSSIPQTDLYTSYALRFAAPSTNENHAGEQNTSTTAAALSSLNQADETYDLSDLDGANQLDPDLDPPAAAVIHHRLLSAVELITLARMTFPECEPAVDDDGKFVIRGLERREGVEKGWTDKSAEMFPFALMSGTSRRVVSLTAVADIPCRAESKRPRPPNDQPAQAQADIIEP